MYVDSPLHSLDPTQLRAAVRKALGRDTAEVIDWHASSIHSAFVMTTGGLYRIQGTARYQNESLPWSLVLKISQNASGFIGQYQDDPKQALYWRREALLHKSAILDRLPPGIVAPRCYGVTEPSEGTVWLWLENIVENVETPWTLERYGLAARHLGAFNGAYLVDRPLPTESCLSRGWLRSFVATVSAPLPEARERSDLERYGWSERLLDRVQRLEADKKTFFRALERLPQTLCHMDAFRGNLLARRHPDGREETVAVDWAFSGIGAIGEDLAVLVAAGVGFYHVEVEQMAELERHAFAGYVAGLRDAGWQGDSRLARLGYTAAAAMRFGIFPYWTALVNQGFASAIESSTGHSLRENLGRVALLTEFLCNQADEARKLLGSLE